jgi:hypothetical protein
VAKHQSYYFDSAQCRAKPFFFTLNLAVKITAVLNEQVLLGTGNYNPSAICTSGKIVFKHPLTGSGRLEVAGASLSVSSVNCNNLY